MRRIPAPAAVLIMAAAVMAALLVWTLAHADDDASPPECPPGLVCEWPTQTPPAPTGEPYPPPEPEPYPAPYPAPEYLPVVAGESYP